MEEMKGKNGKEEYNGKLYRCRPLTDLEKSGFTGVCSPFDLSRMT